MEAFKAAGNRAYAAKKFGAASASYTDAIIICPTPHPAELVCTLSLLYSNRAQCARSREEWADCASDAEKAADIDRNNVKAQYLLGLSLHRQMQWARGAKHLERGLELAMRFNRPAGLVREIVAALAAGRKAAAAEADAIRKQRDTTLQGFLIDVISRHREGASSAASSRGACAPADTDAERHGRSNCYSAAAETAESDPAAAAETPNADDDAELDAQLAHLNGIFFERETARRRRDVPDQFVCQISFELMLDPVISPSGEREGELAGIKALLGVGYWGCRHTRACLRSSFSLSSPSPIRAHVPLPPGHSFERRVITQYLSEIKPEDPHSRAPLHAGQLIPNLALKRAIEEWLAEHPWAHPSLAEAPAEADE